MMRRDVALLMPECAVTRAMACCGIGILSVCVGGSAGGSAKLHKPVDLPNSQSRP